MAALIASANLLAQGPPVRPLGPVTASTTELLGAVSTARPLPGGRVLVNDVSARRLLLFDSTLATYRVVLDSTGPVGYGSRPAGLVAYRGDSSLFIDANNLTMLVIDPSGKPGRVMAIPRPGDANTLIGVDGNPGFDAQGRLVYRGVPRPVRPPAERQPGTPNTLMLPPSADSAPVVRVDMATRAFDTVAMVRIPKNIFDTHADTLGNITMRGLFNPLPSTDDWAVMADGAVAIIRGIDYHVEWVGADGARATTAKIPVTWKHLTDADKVAFMDSTKAAMERIRSEFITRNGPKDTVPPDPAPGPARGAAPTGGAIRSVRLMTSAASDPANWSATRVPPPLLVVQPSELPDYAPPFGPRSARGDADGNLWIRTTISVGGRPVYDIVNRRGELIDRVSIPQGRVIAGFGPGGIVYMGVREGAGVRLERARVR